MVQKWYAGLYRELGAGNWGYPSIGEAHLPAGLYGKIRDPHSIWGTPRARGNTLVGCEVLVASTGATSELDDETLAHEVGAI